MTSEPQIFRQAIRVWDCFPVLLRSDSLSCLCEKVWRDNNLRGVQVREKLPDSGCVRQRLKRPAHHAGISSSSCTVKECYEVTVLVKQSRLESHWEAFPYLVCSCSAVQCRLESWCFRGWSGCSRQELGTRWVSLCVSAPRRAAALQHGHR